MSYKIVTFCKAYSSLILYAVMQESNTSYDKVNCSSTYFMVGKQAIWSFLFIKTRLGKSKKRKWFIQQYYRVRMFFNLFWKKIHYFKTWRYISIKTIIFNSFFLKKYKKLDNRRHYYRCLKKDCIRIVTNKFNLS